MKKSSINRRSLMKQGGAAGLFGLLVASGITLPKQALAAWNKGAFDAKTIDDVLKALGATKPANSQDVQIIASDIAENGAVVPVQAVSRLANTEMVAILVEKNPNLLAALFHVGPDVVADFTTRIKMGQTSNVMVLAKADGKFLITSKEIKVTLGGCGG